MANRDLGVWILPQPIEEDVWVPIPRSIHARFIPFGYKVDPDDETMLLPIPTELDLLEKAKKHLKTYSSKKVAAWLTTQSGRSITSDGLLKRVRSEQSRKSKARYYRELARKLSQALDKAQEYEEKVNRKGKNTFFDSDNYIALRERAAAYLGEQA